MPADNSISQESSKHHGNGSDPYRCYNSEKTPSCAEWSLTFGNYCRHSLDSLFGANDERCPKDCKHKAPDASVKQFDVTFFESGARAAAKISRLLSLQPKGKS